MVDLFGADKGNISLPPRLQSPDVLDGQTDDLKQVMILNMQKAFYQIRITDIAKRIQRLETRNTELEDACRVEKLLRSQTDVETEDQIAQLNRQIFGEMEKIIDHKKRIQTIQKWMEEERQAHLDKVEAANQKYAKTRLAITSEIEILNSKINTLEEYKVSKTDLRNKLIAGNDLMAQRDQEAKQRCEQIQRKFKIGREKLKKEMYARLQGLAGTFQMEVAASIAKPIHRMMRENIFLKNELIDIVKESLPKKEKMKRTKVADVQAISDMESLKKSTVKNLIASKIQGYLLAAVKEQHARVKDCIENLKESENKNEIKSAEDTYFCTKIRADKALQCISRLETGLHRQNVQLGLMNYLRNRSKTELQRCTNVLFDAKYAVACALKMTDTGKDLLKMGNEQLMSYLLNILHKGDTHRWQDRTASLDTVPPPEEAYKIGDLGFEPSHIQLSARRRTTIQRRSSKLSTLKILAALGVKLSGVGNARIQNEPSEIDITDPDAESEHLIDEEADETSAELSLSLESQDEELGQKLIQPEAVDEEEAETDGDVEGQIGTEEELVENEAVNEDENDYNETITGKIDKNRSVMFSVETPKVSLQKNETED